MIARRVVVLPAPLRPSSVITSPARTSMSMPWRTWLSPYQPSRPRTVSSASVAAAGGVFRAASGMSRPDIRFDHARILRDRGVVALGQHLPASQHGDPALLRADVELLAIDTSPFVERYRSNDGMIGSNTRSQDTDAQLAWLDATLSGSRAKWKVVTGHHPIRSGGSGHGDQPEIIARVLPILKRHGVQAYIAGHDHDLQHIRRDGIDMIQCGGGMEARPVVAVEGTRFCRAAAGFGMVQVAGDLLSFDLRDEQGASLYNASVPVRAMA